VPEKKRCPSCVFRLETLAHDLMYATYFLGAGKRRYLKMRLDMAKKDIDALEKGGCILGGVVHSPAEESERLKRELDKALEAFDRGNLTSARGRLIGTMVQAFIHVRKVCKEG